MSLNPEIAQAILDGKVSIYNQNFFKQRDFEDPLVYVRVFQQDGKPIHHGPRPENQPSYIEVMASTFGNHTVVEDVRAFCETHEDLVILSVEPHGLIGMRIKIGLA